MADASIDPVEDHIDDGADDGDDDAELEAMKARVKEMEAEAAKLRELQANADAAESGSASNGRAGSSTPAAGGEDEADAAMQEPQEDVDARSVYIGNVDYGSTPEEIQSHFAACGQINRVTILCDKFTGHPKGFAYVEFAEPAFVTNAMVLDESLFRGRLLKVTPKRTNIPGYNSRGRGRGRGRGQRGGYGFQQPRGRGYRGRGRGYSG